MHQKQRAVGRSENLEGEGFDFIPANTFKLKWVRIREVD